MTFPLLHVTHSDGWASVRTPAKLNLFLEVLRKRDDGFHDISSLMVAVDFYDELRLRLARREGPDTLTTRGVSIPDGRRNSVLTALDRVRERCPVPALEMELAKSIPAGAGLGGGSGNAAGLMALLDAVDLVDLDLATWREVAQEVGSDVPFFLSSGTVVASGRGEVLESFEGTLFGGDQPFFVLVLPGVHCDSAQAYGGVTFPLTSPDGAISLPTKCFVESGHWLSGLFNRLKAPVLARKESLRRIVDGLDGIAPGRWGMTGSGSTFFAVAFGEPEARELEQRVRDLGIRNLPIGEFQSTRGEFQSYISTRVVRRITPDSASSRGVR